MSDPASYVGWVVVITWMDSHVKSSHVEEHSDKPLLLISYHENPVCWEGYKIGWWQLIVMSFHQIVNYLMPCITYSETLGDRQDTKSFFKINK